MIVDNIDFERKESKSNEDDEDSAGISMDSELDVREKENLAMKHKK